ncbi:tetratricopeptide repeat protein [Dokdonella sp.]|uniref:tetratricopeptide repeat protein n=1 Tax=Dokdonella sp. TaxID=2291710 RepID=UPI003C425D1A
MRSSSDSIDAKRLQQIESLFDQALALSPEQRTVWLQQACSQDASLLATLLDMLRFDTQQQTDLVSGIGRLAHDAIEPRDRTGERIGRYLLASRIRYGGMAEVYAAVRDDGEFAHEVALKITRSDRRKAASIAHLFQAERGVLARLRHPNICQIFDGGTTEKGEAWFVMERLDGEPLLTACQGLSWEAALGHFLDLCAAVAHTHRQLIIHRDIKPDNVLLAEGPQGPVVKLLDFGIAGNLGEADSDTKTDNWYSASHAAPEVVTGETGGVGADVYSLGCLLRKLAEQFPRSRRAEARLIAEHASEREPSARYADVELLAEDLRRLRDRRPISILAQRPGYVAWRFIQRRAPLLLGVLALVVLTAWFLLNEQHLRRDAEAATVAAVAQRDRANRIRDFMIDAYESANPEKNAGRILTVSELLERQVATLDEQSQLDTGLRSELLGSLGQAMLGLGRYEQAGHALRMAARLVENQRGPDAALWAGHITLLGQNAVATDHYDEAETLYRSVEARRAEWSQSSQALLIESKLYSSWGPLAYYQGRLDDAERMVRRGIQARGEWSKAYNQPEATGSLMVTLGAIQSARSHLDDALTTFEAAYAMGRAQGSAFNAEHLALLGWLGITFDKLGRSESSEPYLKEAIEVAERLYPEPHHRLSGAYGNLGVMYLKNGRLTEAEPLLRKGLAVMKTLGNIHSKAYQSRLQSFATLALDREDLDAARPLLEQVLELRLASPGDARLSIARARIAIAMLHLAEGNSNEAMTQATQLSHLLEGDDVIADPLRLFALHIAAQAQGTVGDKSAALDLLQRAYTLMQKHPDDERLQASGVLARAKVWLTLGEFDQAYEAYDLAVKLLDAAFPNGHPDRARAQLGMAELCLQRGDSNCARSMLEASGPLLQRNLIASGPTLQAWQRLKDRLH